MLTIGLTGGIGCGKSTAANLFSELSVPVIDADVIAHNITGLGETTLETLFEQFGTDIKKSDGSLDRARLRERVFKNSDEREKLEAIMHPAIRLEMQRQIQATDAPYCILVIPLLLETTQQNDFDRILVVDCTEETQRRRTLERPGITPQQVEAIMDVQCRRDQRLAAADDILYNDIDDIDSLKQQVLVLHQQYVKMSKNA